MAKKPVNDSSLQSTRQMLDELDALMERMLTLPVNEPEQPGAAPQQPAKNAALSATVTLLEPHALARPLPEGDVPAPFNPPHRPVPVAPAPMPEPEPVLQASPRPVPEPEMLTNEVVPASLLPELESLLAAMPKPTPEPTTRLIYLPLVAINLLFDVTTWTLGGGGAWLRTDGGRLVLGFSGVALLIASAGWLLKDWMGWNW
jgi:hypothetical protein